MELKLNGPTAVVALVVVLGFGAYRMTSMQTELETEALEELKGYLVAEYTREDVAAMSEALESGRPVDTEHARAQVEQILSAQNITFPSVDARGFWDAKDGGDAIVRVEIRVDGETPPDGVSKRYYRMRYRPLSGWDVLGQTSVWWYRLKLF